MRTHAQLKKALENYKQQQSEVAMRKGKDVHDALMAARTLSEARRIVYGGK